MSHFVSIETQIKDLDVLQDACRELGLELTGEGPARGIGTQQHADRIIRLKGPCDIAVQQQSKGCYTLATDWWGGYVEKEVGPQYGRLLQLYAVHKATREARRKGLSVQRQPLRNGAIKLTLTGVL
jgi:hypothetical protein